MTQTGKANGGSDDRPQYVRIGDQLRDRIARGDYAVGALLPTEGELCEEFKISRHTVREALRLLTDAGLIQRRQGSGSRVLAAQPHQNYVHAMRSLDQLFLYASDTRFVIRDMSVAVPEPTLFPEIGGDGAEWLIVRGLRLERDEDIPICDSTVMVNAAYAGIADVLAEGSGAIYRLIEDRYGIEVLEVVQDITVSPITAQAAKSLGKKKDDAAVQVRRRYLGTDGSVILASVNHHPTDRFSYTMHLRREGAKRSWV
ncbi:GntR family transcriptional regulator [Flavimaricola marinus]|uniref:Trehalose operon transcriptional repressor n=1 Tax=Flavimaricola marinus TaxID=1819565 RepID=A0A238LEY7_9RHOB|nr:GntR family transcriptional regulator [Flavimaricola marinus]SMY08152.1 Trehalose operon transcriptional repressor [Flavimaricola marinus]